MPREKLTFRVLGAAAFIVAALGLGIFLGAPDVAQAQEDTTTTTVVDEGSTDTTVDESSEESTESNRQGPGDPECGDRAGDGSSKDSSSSDT